MESTRPIRALMRGLDALTFLNLRDGATVSEVAAVKALFGEIPIRGHLPVTIPNVAQRGVGLERPAQVAKAVH